MKNDKILIDYKNYIDKHKENVVKGYSMLQPFLKEFLSKEEFSLLSKNVEIHYNSKYQDDEFYSYAEHFFGGKNRSNNSFEQAKSLHKSRNPHHPEYWKNNNKEMPKVYIVEMVLDWWSFSISKDKPKEIFCARRAFALDSRPAIGYNRGKMQESPSGMASASQADPGGFDSRFLLHLCAYFREKRGNMRFFMLLYGAF